MHSISKCMVRLRGHTFFMPCVAVANLLVAMYDKTSTETPDAYLRLAEKYKLVGSSFQLLQAREYSSHTNDNYEIILMFAHLLQVNLKKPTVCSIQPVYKKIYSTSQKNVNNFEVQYYYSTVPVPYGKVLKKYREVLVRVSNGIFKATR